MRIPIKWFKLLALGLTELGLLGLILAAVLGSRWFLALLLGAILCYQGLTRGVVDPLKGASYLSREERDFATTTLLPKEQKVMLVGYTIQRIGYVLAATTLAVTLLGLGFPWYGCLGLALGAYFATLAILRGITFGSLNDPSFRIWQEMQQRNP